MGIKFAIDIVEEIEKRGSITVPIGYVTGETYEEWLYKNPTENELLQNKLQFLSKEKKVGE